VNRIRSNLKGQEPALVVEIGTAQPPARIYIMDGHPVLIHGLRQIIRSVPGYLVAGATSDWMLGLSEIEILRPDLLLLDLNLPGKNGIVILKSVRVRFPSLKVLVVTVDDEKIYALRAFRAGAGGYIMKDAALVAILEAIRMVLAGDVYLSAGLYRHAMSQFLLHPLSPPKSPLTALTDRELEVYGLLGEGLSRSIIAERLLVSPKTIDSYREHIQRKLHFSTRGELRQRAIQWRC
jgi:DNA-binding NarL/FixJ family response regulator